MTQEILIRIKGEGDTSLMPDDPDDARLVTVETTEEKQFLEWLKENKGLSALGMRTRLQSIRQYKEWQEQ